MTFHSGILLCTAAVLLAPACAEFESFSFLLGDWQVTKFLERFQQWPTAALLTEDNSTSVQTIASAVESVLAPYYPGVPGCCGADCAVPREPNGIYYEPWTFLHVDTGDVQFLIDSGGDAGFIGYNSTLVEDLSGVGIVLADVDYVLVTHWHPDHYGLLVAPDAPLAQAKVIMSQQEDASVRAAELGDNAGLVGTALDALVNPPFTEITRASYLSTFDDPASPMFGTLQLIDSNVDDEILPGVRPVALPGHTGGQMGLMLTSDGESLLCASDIVIFSEQLTHPYLRINFHFDRVGAAASQMKVREMLGDNPDLIVEGTHIPFPGLIDSSFSPLGDWSYERLCSTFSGTLSACTSAELCQDA